MTEAEELELLELEEEEARGFAAPPTPQRRSTDAGVPPSVATPDQAAMMEERLASLPPVADLEKMAAETAAKKAASAPPPAEPSFMDRVKDTAGYVVDRAKGMVPSPDTQETMVKSAAEGASLGLAPYATAAVTAGPGSYEDKLASEKASFGEAVKKDPGSNLIGSFAGPMLGAGALKGLAKVGAMAGIGAGASGISAATHDQPVLPAMGVGGALGGALGGVSAGAGKMLPWLKAKAASRNLKALGADSSDIGRLMRKDMVNDVGGAVADRGVVGLTSSPSSMYEKIQKYLATDGADVGKAADELNASGHRFDMSPTANRLSNELVDPLMKGGLDDQKLGGRVFKELSDLNGRKPQTFAEWLQYKRGMAKHVKHDSLKDAPYRESLDKIAGAVGGEIESQAQRVNPTAAAGLKDANLRFGRMAEAEKIAEKGLKHDLAGGILGRTAAQAAKNTAAVGANKAAGAAGRLSEADAKLLAKWLASRQNGSQGEGK